MDKPLRIITADERFAEKSGAKLTLLGKSGIGKTSHRALALVPDLGQGAAASLLRPHRQARHPRRLRAARHRDDRRADPSTARAGQERHLRRHPRRAPGPFARRKMWSNIGLQSRKGPTWGQMGRSMIRGILNSARNVHPQDNSPQAASARRIQGFHELDGIEFLARVDVEKDAKGEDRNVVKLVVEPDHKDYAALMGTATKAPAGGGNSGAPATAAPQQATTQRPPVPGKPAWAQ